MDNDWLTKAGLKLDDAEWAYDLRPNLSSHISNYINEETDHINSHLQIGDTTQSLTKFIAGNLSVLSSSQDPHLDGLISSINIIPVSGSGPFITSKQTISKSYRSKSLVVSPGFIKFVQWTTAIYTLVNHSDIYSQLIYNLSPDMMQSYSDIALFERYLDTLSSLKTEQARSAVDGEFYVYNPFELIDQYDSAIRFCILHELGHVDILSRRGYPDLREHPEYMFDNFFTDISTRLEICEDTIKWMGTQGCDDVMLQFRKAQVIKEIRENILLGAFDPITIGMAGSSPENISYARRLFEEISADSFAISKLLRWTDTNIPSTYKSIYYEAIIKGVCGVLAGQLHLRCLDIVNKFQSPSEDMAKRVIYECCAFYHRCVNLLVTICKSRKTFGLDVNVLHVAFNDCLYKCRAFVLMQNTLRRNRAFLYLLRQSNLDSSEKLFVDKAVSMVYSWKSLPERMLIQYSLTKLPARMTTNTPISKVVLQFVTTVLEVYREIWEHDFNYSQATPIERMGNTLASTMGLGAIGQAQAANLYMEDIQKGRYTNRE